MKIKDLEYYQQLVKNKNFSKVAQYFGVSQPTITMAIQRLEKDFGTTFFIRDHVHQQLHITATGRQFANHVAVILNELQIARQEIDRAKSDKIRFGLPPIIGNYYFPSLSPQLMRQQLLTNLESEERGSKALLKMLEHGDIDIALLGSLTALHHPRLRTKELAQYPFCIVVGPRYRLAHQQTVNFTDLKDEQFIIPATGFVHEQAFKQMCRNAHFRPHILYRTPDIHVIKAMVSENLGITFLTSLAVQQSDRVTALKIVGNDQPVFRLSAAVRSTAELTTKEEALWKLLSR